MAGVAAPHRPVHPGDVVTGDHGYGAYTRGCRCDECRQAKADYMRRRRSGARRTAAAAQGKVRASWAEGRYVVTDPSVTHGTRSTYEEHGCRCERCTNARTRSNRRYRVREAS